MRTRPAFFSLLTLIAITNRTLAQNTAIVTDGATNSVSFGSQVVPTSGDFTVEFWVYIPTQDVSGTAHEFISQGQAGSGAFYIGYQYLPFPAASTGDTAIITAGDSWTNTGVPLAVGSWTHLALTQTGGTANLYVNDSLWATNSSFSIGASGSNFAIGLSTDGTVFTQEGIDELRIWNLVRTEAQLKPNWYTIDPSTSGLIAYYNFNEGSGTTVTNTATATSGTLNGTLVNSPAWANSPLQAAANAISFDGTTDELVHVYPYYIAGNSIYDFPSGTVEFWAQPQGTITGNGDMVGVRGIIGTRFSYHMSTSALGMWNGTSFATVPFTYASGTWYYLAFVTDGVADTTGVYVNGAYAGQLAQGYNTSLLTAPIVMGASEGSSPGFNDNEFFSGGIDQVYLWNNMRTPAQILGDMTNPLIGTETGLVADYTFDQGIGGGNNSFLTTVIDQTPYNNDAALKYFPPLTGATTDNFISHTIPLPVNWLSFTVTGRNNEAILQWQTAQEENSMDFVIQRSPDGSHFTDIGSVPAAGNASTPRSYSYTDPAPVIGNNFYRLKEEDLSNQFMYSEVRLLTLSGSPNALVWYTTGNKSAEVDYRQGSNQLCTVTDMTGRTLLQGQLSGGKLYLSGLASGVYVVTVFTSTGNLTTKVVIQ
jgi:hypothetical protein